MRRLVCSFALLLPAIAIAQPAPDPASPTPPLAPAASEPAGAPGPAATAPYYPYNPGGPAPNGPVYQPPPPPPLRGGMTFEANLGIGWLHLSADSVSDTSDVGVGGLCLGVGGWLNNKTAITVRLSGVTLSDNESRLSGIFLGPSAQFWVDDHVWLGGGAGLAAVGAWCSGCSDNTYAGDSTTGFGLDLRAGYTFTTGNENTFNASLELTPGFYSENGSSATMTGIALMVGYQHL